MYNQENSGRVITTEVIAKLVASPLSITPVNIMAGFKSVESAREIIERVRIRTILGLQT